MSPTTQSYGERVLAAIMTQCERRGIPPEEAGSVLAHIASETGTEVTDMDARELRRVQQNLDSYFRDYLDGAKRRVGVAPETWPGGAASGSAVMAAARAGIAIADVVGTGKGGTVTVADVEAAAAERDG